jgi:hypothetical protein
VIDRRFSRRGLLKGAAGVALGLPFLEWTSRNASAQAVTPPKRLVVVFHGQGTMLNRWKPAATGAGFQMSELLQPLADFRSKICVISGLNNEVAQIMGGNGHNKAGRSIVTAQTFSNAPTGGGDNGPANGPSIDQVIAGRIRGNTLFKSLPLSVSCSGVGEYQIFFAGKDDPIGAESNPQKAFEQLFASIPTGGGPAPTPPPMTLRDKLRSSRVSVLDGVNQSFASLINRVGVEDRQRLELHADKIRELERLARATQVPPSTPPRATCQRPVLGTLPSKVCDEIQEPTIARAQIKNLAMALACDLTRVATLQFTNYHGPQFPWLGLGIPGSYSDWHALIHRDGGVRPDRDPMAFAGFKYYSDQVALLLNELESFDEGGTSLLDHTLVLWISEYGDGGAHNTDDIPVVLAGGLGGAVRTGQHLSFSGQNRTTNDLFVTLLNLFGGTDTQFGYGADRFNKGPLPGVAA